MKREEMLLNEGIEALRADVPGDAEVGAAAERVAERLGMNGAQAAVGAIQSCEDVQRLFAAYRAGTLAPAKSLLVQAHIRDCSVCGHRFHTGTMGTGAKVLDWSAPKPRKAFTWHPRTAGWSLAATLLLSATGLFVYRAFWQIPPGVRAEVQSIDGSAYRISDNGDRPLLPGDKLDEGDQIRTAGGAHAVLRLSDGSTVEVNERSVLGVGARGNNVTVALDDGDVIVQAAKRTSGHLYLKTPDCRVAVTGTVFSVDSGLKGSRVAVLEGTVDVSQGGVDSKVSAGDQMSTTDKLTPAPMEQQIAWSHDRAKYLPLLAQFAMLQKKIGDIPFPAPRYTSDLLQRVPSDTLLYVSIPNLGEFLNQANQIFHDQLKQSPVLQQWWNQGHDQNTAMLDMLVDKVHQTSEYLGDEIVVVGVKQTGTPGIAVIADVKRAGLGDFLKSQFAFTGPAITVFDPASLKGVTSSSTKERGGFALIRENEAVFSNSVATLKTVNAQLDAGTSGFSTGDFGKQITAAYGRGAGIILAADVHEMMNGRMVQKHMEERGDAIGKSGIEDARYLIAEHREINGQSENQVALQFSGTRKGIASWLAAPAPIGSLNFITPNASIAVAMLSKDPKAIADDLLSMAGGEDGEQDKGLQSAEDMLQVNFREDVAASLGGDFAVSLDGPVLPTPAWKAIIEVNDSTRLEQALERLTDGIRKQTEGKQTDGNASNRKEKHSISIMPSDANGQRFYALHDSVTGSDLAQYTFANGYMIVAPSRALVMEAMHTYASGDSLAHSTAFRGLLPKDASDNYSAVAYQNLTPVMAPLLSEMTGPSADALKQLAADARPTAVCARGEENRIEASSDSRLLQLDFLTLQTLMNLGNHHLGPSVRE
jgi:hypothetical protein